MNQAKELLKVRVGKEQATGFQSPRSTEDSAGPLTPITTHSKGGKQTG